MTTVEIRVGVGTNRQASGPTFYELHRLFDEHATKQTELADALAERIQMLGGVEIAQGIDVSELSRVERAPRGREEVPVQISRLLEGHEHILIAARNFARKATELGDDGTADLVVSEVVRCNEAEAWFISEHLVDTPLVRAHQRPLERSPANDTRFTTRRQLVRWAPSRAMTALDASRRRTTGSSRP